METNGLVQKKKNCFLFLNCNKNKSSKSMFSNCVERLGHKKREKNPQQQQQQTNKEKPRKK